MLLGNGRGECVFLCRLELDSLCRVRELAITNDPDCEACLSTYVKHSMIS